MDQARRSMLVEKYGLFKPPPPRPELKWYSDTTTGPWPIVNAVLDGEQIVASVCRRGYDNGPWFDPLLSPTMHELANRTMRDLRTGMAEGRIERDPDDDRANVPDDPDDDRVFFVHFVGSTRVGVCRAEAEYFASMLKMMAWAHPMWDTECNIKIADNCDGPTAWVPLLRGQFLLIFEGCQACHERAGRLADDGNLVSEMKARAKLPPGAHIQPNPPVPPTT
jgi:hypothetical protein